MYHPLRHTTPSLFAQHTIFSLSSHNAYAGSRLPALTDAIAVGDWDQAQIEIDIIRAHIQSATLFLEG